MASPSQPTSPAGSHSVQVVGNAFVQQYYHISHHSPELVYRFYQEGSHLGRPDSQGAMCSVTTMQAINEKILSMECGECMAEIKTVDAQESLSGGVLVLVTGYLTGKDNVKRDFTQSFFLAPQDKGYFVLNDVFRYMADTDHHHHSLAHALANGTSTPLSAEQGSLLPYQQPVPEQLVVPVEEEEEVDEAEVYNPSDNDEGWAWAVEEETPVAEVIDEVPHSSQPVVADSSSTTVQKEVLKKSYASIVKVMKENAAPLSVPTSIPARPVPTNPERLVVAAPLSVPTHENPLSNANVIESNTVQEAEGDGHSIYIRSLPLDATDTDLEEEFKRFGPIKPGGIQVRSHKQHGFCFGFVEFEVANAVQSAIKASPIMIGGRLAYVEEKRPAGSRVSSRGRFAPGRGSGFWNDGMRGRGSYGGGRGYGRGDFSNRTDFGNRGGGRGGSAGRGGDVGYQRVDSMGSSHGRGSRPGSLPVNASQKNVVPRVPAPA